MVKGAKIRDIDSDQENDMPKSSDKVEQLYVTLL